jgi:putative transposase
MPTYSRRQIVREDEVGVYHCIARCVRRAFLCGMDPYSGHDYSHRKEWILDRLRELAKLFAIEVCDYAVMSNHLHLVLRNRPDIAQQWSDGEIALRWCRLFQPRDDATGQAVEADEHDLAEASVAARPSNSATGKAPEREPAPATGPNVMEATIVDCEPAAGLGPVCGSGVAARTETKRHLPARASDQGFLPIEVKHYVMLLDWTGRELRAHKRGAIPDHLAPILDRLGLDRSNWVETVSGFGRMFKQAAGRSSALVDAAARSSRRWFQGMAAARAAFG